MKTTYPTLRPDYHKLAVVFTNGARLPQGIEGLVGSVEGIPTPTHYLALIIE